MRRMPIFATLAVICLTDLGSSVWAAGKAPDVDTKAITAELVSDKPGAADGAVEDIISAAEQNPGKLVDNLKIWTKALLDAKRYDRAEALCRSVILAAPAETALVAAAQEGRVRALIGAGKPAEALGAAKGLYNVAPMAATADVIILVAEALNAANPGNPAMVQRFRLQQIAGAATQPATGTQAATTGADVLASIKVDSAVFAGAAGKMIGEDCNGLVARGNLLLLADQTAEAAALFDRAVSVAKPNQLAMVHEAVARAMRAQDRSIGRANAYVLALRPAPAGKTNP